MGTRSSEAGRSLSVPRPENRSNCPSASLRRRPQGGEVPDRGRGLEPRDLGGDRAVGGCVALVECIAAGRLVDVAELRAQRLAVARGGSARDDLRAFGGEERADLLAARLAE